MAQNIDIPLQIEIKKGSIFNSKADAMVLSASSRMDHPVGTGLDKAVYEKAGKDDLIAKRNAVLSYMNITELKPGSIFVTDAGMLSEKMIFKKIIHVIVPRYNKKYIEGQKDSNFLFLGSIIEKIFLTARENNIRSLAMPLIGSGALGFKHDDVKRIIVEAFKRILDSDSSYFNRFYLTIFETEEKNRKNIMNYPEINELLKKMGYLIELPDFKVLDDVCLKRWVEDRDGTIRELQEHGTIAANLKVSDVQKYIYEEILYRYHNNSSKIPTGKPKNRFIDLLNKYEDQKNLTDAGLLRKANIKDDTKLSKIRKSQKTLKREFVIRIAMALELTIEEAKEFICIGSAGIEFPDCNDDWEMMVYGSIENKMYDVVMLDEVYNKSLGYPDVEYGMDTDITRDNGDIER